MMVGTALTAPGTAPGPGVAGGGAGVRAGASFLGFYGGVSYMDFFAAASSSDSGSAGETGASYGAELGYGRPVLQRLTLRGLLGVGDYVVMAHEEEILCSGPRSFHASRDNVYLAPGVLLEVALGPAIVGLDANFLYMPSAEAAYAGPGHPVTFASFMGGAQLGVGL